MRTEEGTGEQNGVGWLGCWIDRDHLISMFNTHLYVYPKLYGLDKDKTSTVEICQKRFLT